jgi:hypothetical protein
MNGFEAMLVVAKLQQMRPYHESKRAAEDAFYASAGGGDRMPIPTTTLVAVAVLAAALGAFAA